MLQSRKASIGAFVSISQGNLVCLRREGEARIPRCCLVGRCSITLWFCEVVDGAVMQRVPIVYAEICSVVICVSDQLLGTCCDEMRCSLRERSKTLINGPVLVRLCLEHLHQQD